MAGEPLGPLHGVPFSVKDLLFTKGVRTTMGSADLRRPGAGRGRGAGAPAPRGRRHPDRQDHHARVRPQAADRQPALRRDAQSVESLAHRGRLVRRRRRGGRRPARGRSRSAPTAAARSASPPRAAASSGSSPRSGACPHVHQADLFSSTSYIGPMTRTVAETAACFDAIVGVDPRRSLLAPGADGRSARGRRARPAARLAPARRQPARGWGGARGLRGRGAAPRGPGRARRGRGGGLSRRSSARFLVGLQAGLAARVGPHMAKFGDKVAPSLRESVERGRAVDRGGLGERARPADRDVPSSAARCSGASTSCSRRPSPGRRSTSTTTRSSRSRSTARPPARSAAPGIRITGPFNLSGHPAVSLPCGWSLGRVCRSACRSSEPGTPIAACSPWPLTSSASARARARCRCRLGGTSCRSRPRASRCCSASTSTPRPCGPRAIRRTPSAPS